tara:strand:+ start:659 stop:3478 length:2820 start_codon:yes stop_codon:yes gene_type:complete
MQTNQLNKDFRIVDGVSLPPNYYEDPIKNDIEEESFITTDFRSKFSEDAQAMLDAIQWANASNEGIVDIPSSKYIPKFVERFGEQTFNGVLGLLATGEKIYGLGVGGTMDVLVGLGMDKSSAQRLGRDLMAFPETLPPTLSNSLASYRKLNKEVIANFARDNKVKLDTELLNPKLKDKIKNVLIDKGNIAASKIEDLLISLGFSKTDNNFATVNIGGNISKNKGSPNNNNNTNNIMNEPNHMIIYDNPDDEPMGLGIFGKGYKRYIGTSYRGSPTAKDDATRLFNDFIKNQLTTKDVVSDLPVTITNLPKDFSKLNNYDQRNLLGFLRNLNKNTGWFPTVNNIMATEIPDNLAKFNSAKMIQTGFKIKNTNILQKFFEPIFGTSKVESLESLPKNFVLPKNYKQRPEELIFREKSTIKLSEVLDHDILFDIYPELRDLRIRFMTPKELVDPEYAKTGGYFQRSEDLDPSSPNYDPMFDNDYSVIALNPSIFIDNETQRLKSLSLVPQDKNYIDVMETILHEIQHAVQARSGIDSSYAELLNTYKKNVVDDSKLVFERIDVLRNKRPDLLKDATVLYKGNYATGDYDIVFYTKSEFDRMMKDTKKMYPNLSYSKRKEKAEEIFLQKFLPNKADVSKNEYEELKNSFVPISIDEARHLATIQHYTFKSELGRDRSADVILNLTDPKKTKLKETKEDFIDTLAQELDEKDIDNFFNYWQKMNEVEARATQNRFKLSNDQRVKNFIYDDLTTDKGGRTLSMADVMIKSVYIDAKNIDKLDVLMDDLKQKLFSAIRKDVQPTQFILHDEEVDYFVDNLLYQRFSPIFLAGEPLKAKNQTIFEGLKDIGFENTSNVIKDNIQTKIYDDIAFRYYGLQKGWRKTVSNETLDKIKRTFNSVYYAKDGRMNLSEVSQIDPILRIKSVSTLDQTPMTNELNIIRNFKPK